MLNPVVLQPNGAGPSESQLADAHRTGYLHVRLVGTGTRAAYADLLHRVLLQGLNERNSNALFLSAADDCTVDPFRLLADLALVQSLPPLLTVQILGVSSACSTDTLITLIERALPRLVSVYLQSALVPGAPPDFCSRRVEQVAIQMDALVDNESMLAVAAMQPRELRVWGSSPVCDLERLSTRLMEGVEKIGLDVGPGALTVAWRFFALYSLRALWLHMGRDTQHTVGEILHTLGINEHGGRALLPPEAVVSDGLRVCVVCFQYRAHRDDAKYQISPGTTGGIAEILLWVSHAFPTKAHCQVRVLPYNEAEPVPQTFFEECNPSWSTIVERVALYQVDHLVDAGLHREVV